MDRAEFTSAFVALNGAAEPFPWQYDLFAHFAAGDIPACCDLPTGLGKTSVVAIWLIALARFPDRVPRRLVYVVNRRTVVDQTTAEVERLRRNLGESGLQESLAKLCVLPSEPPFAISTLRGQFADNREWSADPCRPAVIIGTVDMIGSRLLFSGYRLGFKAKPMHAAFLGQDTLIVHDEAHLEPAFQELLTAMELEQKNTGDTRKIRVMELSATPRSEGETFVISRSDEENPEVAKRLGAVKALHLHEVENADAVRGEIIKKALRHQETNGAVLVFATGVKDVEQIAAGLEKDTEKDQVLRLTGTMRGLERDDLVKSGVFRRFLQPRDVPNDAEPETKGTVYLVCTSAGEVGVNLSADYLVCDVSTFDSMAQRFGRVNRFGNCDHTEIDVVHPVKFADSDPREQRRAKTLELLRMLKLKGSANPNAIRALDPKLRQAAFNPPPKFLLTSDILFDAWSLTTITGSLPGRPPVASYLHGIAEDEPAMTQVVWREEVFALQKLDLEGSERASLLADYPLKPHEMLKDLSTRVAETLAKIAAQNGNAKLPVWLIDDEKDGEIEVLTLGELADKRSRERIFNRTVLLPPEAGGLSDGLLDAASKSAKDVADKWYDEDGGQRRVRVWDDDEDAATKTSGLRLIRQIDTRPFADEDDEPDEASRRFWRWYELPRSADSEGSRFAPHGIPLDEHTRSVEALARAFARRSGLSDELIEAVRLAGKFHDLGKKRTTWQRSIGNFTSGLWLAKSGKNGRTQPFDFYRHEFGSLLDLQDEPEFQSLSDEMKDLVLHLIAAHHGRGRPHFPADECFDRDRAAKHAAALAAETPLRFARLQRRHGRWGLAWLESLLRAADYAASAAPDFQLPPKL